MSYCGGQLIGYFLKNDLVLLEAKINVEFSVENYICVIDKLCINSMEIHSKEFIKKNTNA